MYDTDGDKSKRQNRLAVFEHLPPKEKSSSRVTRSSKRLRSPEPTYEDTTTEVYIHLMLYDILRSELFCREIKDAKIYTLHNQI